MMDAKSRQRLDEQMPWYVNGRIDAQDERAWMERVVREEAQAKAALEWHRLLQRDIQASVDSLPEVGLEGLMRKVHAGEAGSPKAVEARKSSPGWIRGLLQSLQPRTVYAFASVIIVLQAGIIGALMREGAEPQYAQTRETGAPAGLQGPVLQVTFKPELTEREMRMLLVNVGGRVMDGPSQLCDYIVFVPADRIEAAREAFERSGMVDAVVVLERRPHRE
jgi:hypothetical protein